MFKRDRNESDVCETFSTGFTSKSSLLKKQKMTTVCVNFNLSYERGNVKGEFFAGESLSSMYEFVENIQQKPCTLLFVPDPSFPSERKEVPKVSLSTFEDFSFFGGRIIVR